VERKLKLIKTESVGEELQPALRPAPTKRALRIASLPPLTLAERFEAARFKALTTTKAARQARLRRMMAQLQDLDEVSPAA
jgi:hypothetical protein